MAGTCGFECFVTQFNNHPHFTDNIPFSPDIFPTMKPPLFRWQWAVAPPRSKRALLTAIALFCLATLSLSSPSDSLDVVKFVGDLLIPPDVAKM